MKGDTSAHNLEIVIIIHTVLKLGFENYFEVKKILDVI